MELLEGEEIVGTVSRIVWYRREVEEVLGLPTNCAIRGWFVPSKDAVIVIRDFIQEGKRKLIRSILEIPKNYTDQEITQAFEAIVALPKRNS